MLTAICIICNKNTVIIACKLFDMSILSSIQPQISYTECRSFLVLQSFCRTGCRILSVPTKASYETPSKCSSRRSTICALDLMFYSNTCCITVSMKEHCTWYKVYVPSSRFVIIKNLSVQKKNILQQFYI